MIIVVKTPAATTQNEQSENIKDTDKLIDEKYNQIQAWQLKEQVLVQAEETMNRRFATEFLNFKLKYQKLVSKSYENYDTHLKNLEEQIQYKDKMIDNLLHIIIKVLTTYKGSPVIAVCEKRDVNDSHVGSFNVPLIDNNVDHSASVSKIVLIVPLKMKCVVMILQQILYWELLTNIRINIEYVIKRRMLEIQPWIRKIQPA